MLSTRLRQYRFDSNFARGLVFQAGTRDTLSCKDCHQLTGPHGHVSGPLVKVDMGHYFRRGAMISRSNRLLGPETRPCVQTESHSYSRY